MVVGDARGIPVHVRFTIHVRSLLIFKSFCVGITSWSFSLHEHTSARFAAGSSGNFTNFRDILQMCGALEEARVRQVARGASRTFSRKANLKFA